MEPENPPVTQLPPATALVAGEAAPAEPYPAIPALPPGRGLRWVFFGEDGLRAGWSILIFMVLMSLFTLAVGSLVSMLYPAIKQDHFSAIKGLIGELIPFIGMLGAGLIVARIERRSILDYNLTGPRRTRHFIAGLAAGFVALSALVGALAAGGWLHFGPIALSGADILKYAALWGAAFVLVGFVEEGLFRCYFQFTLTRGVNFWVAAGLIGLMCLSLALRAKGNGVWGVYGIALLGLPPCWLLHSTKAPGGNFWQAAWVTSTTFGFIHTGNNGENWIGIFAAAAIGFVFCVSVRVTGSAWWAIGCHAAWDWAETYFYGTADSGLPAQGHYLTTSPAGSAFWSGGTDGPEGSVLVLAVILALLLALLALYGRSRSSLAPAPALQRAGD